MWSEYDGDNDDIESDYFDKQLYVFQFVVLIRVIFYIFVCKYLHTKYILFVM